MKYTFIMSNDFLTNKSFNNWLIKLFKPIIKAAAGCEVVDLKDITLNEEHFSREKFYALSNIYEPQDTYYIYDINKIKPESWEYFFQFLPQKAFFIGEEIHSDLLNKLTERGIPYINFWFHSYKLFDDITLMLHTNNLQIFNKIKKYQIPRIQFEFYANYWITNITQNRKFDDSFLEDNSIVFIGQSLKDKSIKKNDKFLNILDFKERLEELSEEYSKIYYIPHPCSTNSKEINRYINNTKYLQVLENIPSYYLLTSNKIKKVVGISSSVLYEASFFGKEVEYLYKPLFDIDGEFQNNTYISVYNDYFNPYFWSDILSPIMETNSDVINKVLFFEDSNKIREIRNFYWGYRFLQDKVFVSSTQNQGGNVYNSNQLERKSFIQTIFSVTNSSDKSHKIVTLFGMKIKFRKKVKRDFSLNTGERQTAQTLEGIRQDHLNRYELAIKYINQELNTSKQLNGLDIFCGNGYGSYLISKNIKNANLLSFDASKEAIDMAKSCYKTDKITFKNKIFPFKLAKNKYDFAVSLESIEHIKDDNAFLNEITKSLKKGGLLIISTPNAEQLDLAINPNKFHYRHYKTNDFISLLKSKNFKVLDFYGQDTYILNSAGICTGTLDAKDIELVKRAEKQFIIYVCRKL